MDVCEGTTTALEAHSACAGGDDPDDGGVGGGYLVSCRKIREA